MRDPQCMAEHQRPPLGECTCDAYTRGEEYGRQGGYEVGYKVGLDEGQRDEREACIAAVSAPTLHDDACCSNGCTLMHSSRWEATRRIQIAYGFPLSEGPPPPYRCDGSCNCTAAAFIAAIRAREEKP